CLLLALHPVREVVRIDVHLPLFDANEAGERTRKLTRRVFAKLGMEDTIDEALGRLHVHLTLMDVTAMTFPDDSFDFLTSRAAMEHIIPVETALREMARVVLPGGLI